MKKLILILLLTASVTVAKQANAQVSLRTNALGWALATANIGVEVGLSEKMTFLTEGYYSPFWDLKNFRARGYLITPELRYYFCQAFQAHYLGVHGNYANYKKFQFTSENNIKTGYAFAVGLTYGYTWLFDGRWSLDLFIGAGWWNMHNDVYCRYNPSFKLADNITENKFGLTRLGASFTYTF